MNGTNTREKSIAKHVAGSIKVESKHQDCVVSFLSAKQCPLLIDRQYCQNINVRSSMEVADQSLVGDNLFRLDFGSSNSAYATRLSGIVIWLGRESLMKLLCL